VDVRREDFVGDWIVVIPIRVLNVSNISSDNLTLVVTERTRGWGTYLGEV
jgi:hypothetical protein